MDKCDFCTASGTLRDFGGTLCDECFCEVVCSECRESPKEENGDLCDACQDADDYACHGDYLMDRDRDDKLTGEGKYRNG